ncbi:sodium-dependent transporter, partial [candidate division KSB1 bacterium]
FYGVIAGWIFGYIFKTIAGGLNNISSPEEAEQLYKSFCGNPVNSIGLFFIFIFMTSYVIYKGVKGGIEKWSKILMPALLILLFLLIIRSVTLPGAFKGLEYYLVPDFSKVEFKTILVALGQAFFSLSLGMGTMLTYGSYIAKKDNIVSSAFYVCVFDTGIAVVAGFIFFPALFAMGMAPDQGPALIFHVLPSILSQIPGGQIFGIGLFVLISIAALTSTVSLLEVPVAYVVDEKGWSRLKAVLIMGGAAFIIGIPSALSAGAVSFLEVLPGLGEDFLDVMSTIFGQFSLSIGSLFIALFVGWKWGIKNAINEIEQERVIFRIKSFWSLFIKYVCPIAISIIFIKLIVDLF